MKCYMLVDCLISYENGLKYTEITPLFLNENKYDLLSAVGDDHSAFKTLLLERSAILCVNNKPYYSNEVIFRETHDGHGIDGFLVVDDLLNKLPDSNNIKELFEAITQNDNQKNWHDVKTLEIHRLNDATNVHPYRIVRDGVIKVDVKEDSHESVGYTVTSWLLHNFIFRLEGSRIAQVIINKITNIANKGSDVND